MKHQLSQGIREIPDKSNSRCVWSSKEDNALKEASKKYKGEYWNLVAEYVQKFSSQDFSPKTAKQCRERWNNQLSPKVKLSALSEDEIRNVFLYHSKFGNRWSKIAN